MPPLPAMPASPAIAAFVNVLCATAHNDLRAGVSASSAVSLAAANLLAVAPVDVPSCLL